MDDLITTKGMELKDGIAAGDIVTLICTRPKDNSYQDEIFEVVTANGAHAVLQYLTSDYLNKAGDRCMVPIGQFRFFEASEVWEAMRGHDGSQHETVNPKVDA